MAPWLPWLSCVSPNRLAALFCGLTWFVSLAECIHPTRKAGGRQQMGKKEHSCLRVSGNIAATPRNGPQLWLRSGVEGFPRCWQVAGGPPGCWWQAPVSLRQIFPHEAKLSSRGPGPVVLVRNGSLASAKGNVSPESARCSMANPTTRMRALVADPSPRSTRARSSSSHLSPQVLGTAHHRLKTTSRMRASTDRAVHPLILS